MSAFTPSRILSYVVASDRGLAPNVEGGVCTLAVCKPVVRSSAVPGRDWIVGLSTAAHGRDRVIYAMQAEDKIDYGDFFANPAFACKKPGRGNPWGDNFFEKKGGVYRIAFNTAAHFGNPVKIARDIKSPFAVAGRRFWYFGETAPRLPPLLRDTLLAIPDSSRRGHRVVKDAGIIRTFTQWLEKKPPGVHGRPRDSAPRG